MNFKLAALCCVAPLSLLCADVDPGTGLAKSEKQLSFSALSKPKARRAARNARPMSAGNLSDSRCNTSTPEREVSPMVIAVRVLSRNGSRNGRNVPGTFDATWMFCALSGDGLPIDSSQLEGSPLSRRSR